MPEYRLGRLKGKFVVVFDEGGRRKRYRLGTSRASVARDKLRAFVELRERRATQPARTVAELWAEYLSDREAEGKASIRRMKETWRQLSASFGHLDVAGLEDGSLVRAYIEQRRAQGRRDATIRTELTYLRACLRYGARRHGFTAPVFTLPPHGRPRDRWLTGKEARALMDAAQYPHVRLFIQLALFTAGRPSAILDLTWDRVDFERERIMLDDPAKHRTAKGRATVPLNPALAEPLREARYGALSPHVIEWGGKRVKSVKRAIGAAAVRAGLENVSPYVLRHTAAVWMAQAGVPMSEISQYLGHTSTAVTERTYARFGPDYLRKASGAIGAALFGSPEPEQKDRA